jgi:hypothetical protein
VDILLIKYPYKTNKFPNCERKIMEKDVETLTQSRVCDILYK